MPLHCFRIPAVAIKGSQATASQPAAPWRLCACLRDAVDFSIHSLLSFVSSVKVEISVYNWRRTCPPPQGIAPLGRHAGAYRKKPPS